jgi:hypothetical protein
VLNAITSTVAGYGTQKKDAAAEVKLSLSIGVKMGVGTSRETPRGMKKKML